MNVAQQSQTDAVRTGAVTYLAASVETSLYRNGKVLVERNSDGNDTPWEGTDTGQAAGARFTTHAAWRGRSAARSRPTASKCWNGRWRRPTSTFWITSRSCAAITRTAPTSSGSTAGARIVKAFDHNVRSATGKLSGRRIAGGQQVQRPAHVVHGDYTLTSGPQRLRDLANPPTVNDTYRTQLADGETLLDEADVTRALGAGRFALINLWRNIADEPVATNPLALCDAASVHPNDLVVFEIHYADRIGENYFAKHADAHRWYFYPALTRDEALLIKQWDSAGGLARSEGAAADAMSPDMPCTFSFHTAFEDPTTAPDAPDRWSIEVRCIVLYD